MYRTPEVAPRPCPMCGESSWTPETKLDPTEGYLKVRFRVANATHTFLGGTPSRDFTVSRARVCLGCGFVATSLSASDLHELKDELSSLTGMPTE